VYCDKFISITVSMRDFRGYYLLNTQLFKGTCSPYSIAERRIRELTLVLGSQPAGDVSHKPGCRLPLLFHQARSYPRNP